MLEDVSSKTYVDTDTRKSGLSLTKHARNTRNRIVTLVGVISILFLACIAVPYRLFSLDVISHEVCFLFSFYQFNAWTLGRQIHYFTVDGLGLSFRFKDLLLAWHGCFLRRAVAVGSQRLPRPPFAHFHLKHL